MDAYCGLALLLESRDWNVPGRVRVLAAIQRETCVLESIPWRARSCNASAQFVERADDGCATIDEDICQFMNAQLRGESNAHRMMAIAGHPGIEPTACCSREITAPSRDAGDRILSLFGASVHFVDHSLRSM